MNFRRSARAAIFAALIMSAMVGMSTISNAVDEGFQARDEAMAIAAQTQSPAEPEPTPVTEEPVATPTRYYPTVSLDQSMQDFIFQTAEAAGVDYEMVLAIIIKESACDPDAVSSTGDYGLMQINRINHAWLAEQYGLTDMFDPRQNVTAGIIILADLSSYNDGTDAGMHRMLMAYNMGPTGASNAWDSGTFTSSYSEAIMQVRDSLIHTYA